MANVPVIYSLLFTGSVGVPAQWFTSRRSLANGVSTAGSGIGGLIWSLATSSMIQRLGLPWTFRVLALLTCVVNTICSLLLRDRSKTIGSSHLAFDYRMFYRLEFNLLLTWGVFSMIGYTILQFTLPDYAQSVGLSASEASVVAAVLSLGQAIGRPLVGYFSDSFGKTNMAGLMTLLVGVMTLVIWTFSKTLASLVICALLLGLVFGTFWSTITPVGIDVVGMKDLPNALALVWLLLTIPTTASEPIALALRGTGGEYLNTQLFTGAMYCAGALSMWALRSWKYCHLAQQRDQGDRESGPSEKVKFQAVIQGLFTWQRL